MPEALDKDVYLPLVRSALAEDVGSGDVTTMSLIPQDSFASGVIVAKEPLVVAGVDLPCRRKFKKYTFVPSVVNASALSAAGLCDLR